MGMSVAVCRIVLESCLCLVMQMCCWVRTIACACGALVRAGARRLSELRRLVRVAAQTVSQQARASEVVGRTSRQVGAAILPVHRSFFGLIVCNDV